MRKVLVIAAASLSVAVIGGGVAAAASRTSSDPAAERSSEARYTAAHRSEAAVRQADAEAAAAARHPGTVVDSHLEDEGQGLRWEIKTDDGTQVWELQVGATTGRVVSDQPDD